MPGDHPDPSVAIASLAGPRIATRSSRKLHSASPLAKQQSGFTPSAAFCYPQKVENT
jgi:hypothetical protein